MRSSKNLFTTFRENSDLLAVAVIAATLLAGNQVQEKAYSVRNASFRIASTPAACPEIPERLVRLLDRIQRH